MASVLKFTLGNLEKSFRTLFPNYEFSQTKRLLLTVQTEGTANLYTSQTFAELK